MPVKLAPFQLAFWQELLAPFESSQLSVTKRGGKELTYVDKRSITNRLDSVCGPHGWFPKYESTARGYKCSLSILVPVVAGQGAETSESWEWLSKEDGAGFEEMGSANKTTGEFEYDVDNDEKSGYTNALRRAAQDAWGIGRYLYGKGIPTFLSLNTPALSSTPTGSHLPAIDPVRTAASIPPKELRDPAPAPSTREQPPYKAPAAPATPAPAYDNFKIPKPGKSVFAWTKEMEKTFETTLVARIVREAESQGWGSRFAEWTEPQVNTLALGAIRFIRDLPTYQGQFEHILPGGHPAAGIQTVSGTGPNVPQPAPGVNIADLRKALIMKIGALYSKVNGGAKAENAQLKSIFQQIAPAVLTGQGHTGEVPEALGKIDDVVWITNISKAVDEQIAAVVAAEATTEDDCPF